MDQEKIRLEIIKMLVDKHPPVTDEDIERIAKYARKLSYFVLGGVDMPKQYIGPK